MKRSFLLYCLCLLFGIRAMNQFPLSQAKTNNVALKSYLTDKITAMIQSGEDLNQQIADFPIPWKRPLLIVATLHNFVGVVQLLLDNGADPNVIHAETGSALHVSARCGYCDISRLLLGSANPNVTAKYKRTPLALASSHGFVSVAKLLLKAGAGPNACDCFGMRPLMSAVAKGYCVQVPDEERKQMLYVLLFNGGLDKYCRNLDKKTAYDLALANNFLKSAATLARYETYKEFLFTAIRRWDVEQVKKLAQECTLMVRDANGDTPLHHAVDANCMPIVGFLCSTLIQLINCINRQGYTPIHLAANKRPLYLFSKLYAYDVNKPIKKTIDGPRAF